MKQPQERDHAARGAAKNVACGIPEMAAALAERAQNEDLIVADTDEHRASMATTMLAAFMKRLRKLQAFDRLGAGFAISARDLDMRGAGDLPGDTQAGHMKLIGVELYQQLIEDAQRAAQGDPVDRWTPELRLGIAGELPSDWIPEEDLRLTLYARLSRLRSDAEIDSFEAELEDRFGDPPPPTRTLLAISRLHQRAHELDIARIDAGPAAIALTPRRGATPVALADPPAKDGRRLLTERIDDPAARIERLAELLE